MENANQGHELDDLEEDLERQLPRNRTYRWFKKIRPQTVDDEAPSGAGSINEVTVSETLTEKFTVLVRWAPKQNKQPTPGSPVDHDSSRKEFLKAVIGMDNYPTILRPASTWYIAFLEFKICETWKTLFQPILLNIDVKAKQPDAGDLKVAFKILSFVARNLNRRHLALTNLVDDLYNQKYLNDGIEGDDDRIVAHQLTFSIIGWISILYTPHPDPISGHLEIKNGLEAQVTERMRGTGTQTSPTRRKLLNGSRTFVNYKQTLENNDQPLHILLRAFGKIIPEYNRETSPSDAPGSIPGRPDGWIDVSLVCFHTLHKVANIQVEWVDCLSLHLEFDSQAKVLKLFRHPSICFLLRCKEDTTIMSQIFQESAESSETGRTETDDATEYFREVLLSYRLIFGQTKSSHHDFNKYARKWPILQTNPDPMLQLLCGQSWDAEDARAIWQEIGADTASNHYSPMSDFPFLGKRLAELQSYVRGHSPHNIMALWYDRRNVSWWWTFWAVIIIGGATLIFALLQSVLSIVQVVYSREQVRLAQQQPP